MLDPTWSNLGPSCIMLGLPRPNMSPTWVLHLMSKKGWCDRPRPRKLAQEALHPQGSSPIESGSHRDPPNANREPQGPNGSYYGTRGPYLSPRPTSGSRPKIWSTFRSQAQIWIMGHGPTFCYIQVRTQFCSHLHQFWARTSVITIV